MNTKKIIISALCTVSAFTLSTGANAEMYQGQVLAMGTNFCPRGTIDANGQLLSIQSYQSMFSLYNTTYGGDGRTTFGIPDLRGRYMTHTGNGPGLNPRRLGQRGGRENVTISSQNMPSHTHQLESTNAAPNANKTDGALLAEYPNTSTIYNTGGANNVAMSAKAIAHTGGGQSVNVVNPFLTMRYCIVMEGIYPSRP